MGFFPACRLPQPSATVMNAVNFEHSTPLGYDTTTFKRILRSLNLHTFFLVLPIHHMNITDFPQICVFAVGRDSVVGIATRYVMEDLGIESQRGGGELFHTRPARPWGPPSLLHNGYRLSR
jgi:hypothetical protein